jgi:uncharacterized protein (DUF433 family)
MARMSQSASTTWKYLAPQPKSAYRQLFVEGTRIRARDLYGLHKSTEGAMTPEEIAVDFGLPLAAVQEAIAYCESQPPEIAEDFAREAQIMAATGMDDPDYKLGGQYRLLTPQQRAQLGL